MGFTTRNLVKTESQPVLIPAGFTGGQVYFPDNQYIRNKKLLAVELVTNLLEFISVGGQTKYIDGKDIANYELCANGYLTLESYAGVQYLRKKTIISFSPFLQVSQGNAIPPNFIGQRTNWPKCYVEFPTIAATTKDQYILFDIFFTEISKETIMKQLGAGFANKK